MFPSFIGIKAVSSSNSALLGLGSSVQPVYAVSAATWHEGTNQYTSLANVTYGELYNTLGANQTCLTRTVWINYNDHTNAFIGLTVRYDFNPGGLDISHQQVLNWSKLTYSDLGINTGGVVNKTQVGTIYFFKGFDITKGTSGNFTLSQTYYNNAQNAPGSYSYNVNNVVGGISYLNYSTAQISAVALSTVNTTYKGIAMTDSIATFNVTFSAQISSKPLAGTLVGTSQNQTLINMPVVFMFQITHDAAHTQYKYGVYIDWSIMKAFPNWGGLKSGDSFCLVADDYLQFLYNNTKADDQFSSDANNDSAIYRVNGIEVCRELFPVNYTISGSIQPYNTARIYVPDAIYNPAATNTSKYDSKTFVCFSGFIYNQSSGFTFDPTIITPNSITASNIKTNTNTPTASNTLTVIILLSTAIVVIAAAATGTVVIVKRRRERRLNFNPKPKTQLLLNTITYTTTSLNSRHRQRQTKTLYKRL